MIKKLIFLSFMIGLSASLGAQTKKKPQETGKNQSKAEDKVKPEIYQNWPSTKEGIKYKIHVSKESERTVIDGDYLSIHMIAVLVRTDSVLFDTYKDNKMFEIPSNETTLKSVFSLMRKGDSTSFVVIADSLFTNSFNQPLPDGVKAGDKILFHTNLIEIYNQVELSKNMENKNLELRLKDSLDLSNFLVANPIWKKTENGLYYQIEKAGNGKKPNSGDQVTVTYIGKFLNGDVFDKSDKNNPEFTFTVKNNMVIPGFEESISLMQEGGSAKFIIPWQLAYGETGSGPIQPFTSLVFEIKLIKIKSK